MRVPWNGNCNVHCSTDGGPHEPGHALGPSSTQNLDRESDRIDIWAVVRNDTQTEYDQAELAKAAKRSKEYGTEEASRARRGVSVGVLVRAIVECGCSHDRNSQHFSEEERDDQPDPHCEKDLCS